MPSDTAADSGRSAMVWTPGAAMPAHADVKSKLPSKVGAP
jgi:hypothetical protein